MGCDIHLYIEYANKDDKREEKMWESVSFGSINCPRDYRIFGYLTDGHIRYNDVNLKFGIEPRGLPVDKLSYQTQNEWDTVKDEVHNPSWLTYDEYKMILKSAKKDKSIDDTIAFEYHLILKIMKELEKNRFKTRVVFWFDS